MGKKDLWQCDYFDDRGRFVDMINGFMFKGEQIMKEDELEEVDSKLIHHEKNNEAVSVIRDKVYKWKGQYVSIYVLENQSYVDYRMVFRVMLEEAVSYMKQQKRAFKKWHDVGYKFTNNEFLSRMRKDEKYIPVVTLILYLGNEKIWDGAKSLYELLEIDEELKPFVTNHKLNIFDYHEYEDFSQFKTDNRFLFEMLSSAKDEEKMEKVIREYLDDYSLDKDTARAIFGMLDIKVDLNKIRRKTEKGMGYNMCKAWDDHIERGRQEGRQEAMRESLAVLINSLKKILPDVEAVYNAVVENEIYSEITREQVRRYYNAN